VATGTVIFYSKRKKERKRKRTRKRKRKRKRKRTKIGQIPPCCKLCKALYP